MAIFSQKTDTLIRISNDRLLDICGVKTTIYAAFLAVDEMIQQVVQTIVEAITKPGMINLDFMDIKSVFKDSGLAIASIGVAVGQDRAICAARASLTSALVDIPIYEATSVFLSISGANGFSLSEVNDVADIIFKAVNPEAKLIFTACHNPNLKGYLKVIMIASGSQKIHDMELINYPEDKHFYDSVGQLLKQVRIEAGRTQVECAKVTGLKSGVGYANYESGKRRIPLSRLRIISNYLGRDLAYFLRGAKESENKLLAHPTIEVDHAKPIPHQHRAIKKILVLPDKERGAEVVQKGEKRDLVWTMATIKWDSLIEQTAQYFLIETRDILSKSQNRRVSLARQIAIYLMREHSSMSFAEIGEYFTRDPSTVFNAYKKIAAYSILDSKLKQHLRLIKEKLKLPDQV
jgi:transcriptional regulator with XRE-family HTH domain